MSRKQHFSVSIVLFFFILSLLQQNDCFKTSETSIKKVSAEHNSYEDLYEEYRRKNFTDVTLSLGDRKFEVHREVVIHCSPVLAQKLNDKLITTVELNEQFVSPSIINPLLTYFYKSRYDLNTNNIYQTLPAAHHLSISALLKDCESFLTHQTSFGNASKHYILAKQCQLETLEDYTAQYIMDHYDKVFQNSETLNHSFGELKLLINELYRRRMSDEMKQSVLEFLVHWVQNGHLNDLQNVLHSFNFKSIVEPMLNLENDFLGPPSIRNLVIDKFMDVIDNHLPKPTSGLYCFLGRNETGELTNVVTHMDLDHDTWTTLPQSKLQPRAYVSYAVIGQKVYMFGGMGDYNHKETIINVTEIYDCSKSSSETGSPLPGTRKGSAAAVHNGSIYVSGGLGSDTIFDTVFRYDVKDNKWENILSMKVGRWAHQMVEFQDRLYVIGGDSRKEVEVYDPAEPHKGWSLVNSFPNFEHNWGSAVVHQGMIYLLSNAGFEAYSPETGWKILPTIVDKLKFKPSLYGISMISMRGKLWVFGGTNGYCGEKSVFSYNLTTGNWTHEPDMDAGKTYHFCALVES